MRDRVQLRGVAVQLRLGHHLVDEAEPLGLGGAEAAAALAGLESLGYVNCSLVGVYTRTTLHPSSGNELEHP